MASKSSLTGTFTIQGGSGSDLTSLTATNQILPQEMVSEVTSPKSFILPAPLQGEDAVFFQVTN